MTDLDKYLSTPDEHFNTNAQYWYFGFTGAKKPETDKPFEVFIQALYEVYFFIIDNPDKPFTCIEKIKEASAKSNFNEAEKLILVNKVLGVLINAPYPELIQKVFIQIVDYRNDLSPYLEDPEIIEAMTNHKFRFDIEDIKTKLKNIDEPGAKYEYLMNLVFDINASANEIDELEQEYYESEGLLNFLETEIKRAKFNMNLNKKQQDTTGTQVPATKPKQEPEPETNEDKIKRILEPIRGAFDTPGHLDLIIKALAEHSDTGNLPEKAETRIIQVDNKDFYPYFKSVKNETRLTVPGIAAVLTYFICQNNGSGNPIAPGTIEKNIKQNYPKL